MVLVSACLAGQNTRYDGGRSTARELLASLERRDIPFLALCPEVLGGLAIPREPAGIQGAEPGREGLDVLEGKARVIRASGRDATPAYVLGARRVLEIAQRAGVKTAYLKDRSPSCAWDPQGQNPGGGPGMGVLAALLNINGIKVIEVRVINRPDQTSPAPA